MSRYVCFNGQFIKDDGPVLQVNNRAFSYGDGVFETIRCLNSRPLFFEKHYQRLRSALFQLKMEMPAEFTENYFRLIIYNFLQKSRIYKGARVKLTVFRNEGGFYTPADNSASYVLTADSLESELFVLNEKGLKIGIYSDITKLANPLSCFKTCSALFFVMAGQWKKEQAFDDVFIKNEKGNIIEALASNIFLVKSEKLITPSVESGCVDGTMRRTILEIAAKNNIAVLETDKIQEQHILSVNEVFLTNAISGIQWVGAYKSHRYFHTVSEHLLKLLNDSILKASGESGSIV